jgi:hypothetical protein
LPSHFPGSRPERGRTCRELIAVVIAGQFAYGIVGSLDGDEPSSPYRRQSPFAWMEVARRQHAQYGAPYYINVNAGVRVTSENTLNDWRYLVSCEGARDEKLIAEYNSPGVFLCEVIRFPSVISGRAAGFRSGSTGPACGRGAALTGGGKVGKHSKPDFRRDLLRKRCGQSGGPIGCLGR